MAVEFYSQIPRQLAPAGMESIEKSLERSIPDVYLIQWPDRTVPFEEPIARSTISWSRGKVARPPLAGGD
jgi:hypothetical protein